MPVEPLKVAMISIETDKGTLQFQDSHFDTAIIAHDKRVTCVATLPDGGVVSGSKDRTLRLWHPDSIENSPAISSDPINCLAISVNGSVISGSESGEVRLWDQHRATSELLPEGHHEISLLYRLRVAMPNGNFAFAEGDFVFLCDSKFNQSCEIMKHEGEVTCLAVFGDHSVVSGGKDGVVRLWDSTTKSDREIIAHDEQRRQNEHRRPSKAVTCLLATDDGCVYSGGMDGRVNLWKQSSKELSTVNGHPSAVSWLQQNSDGTFSSGSCRCFGGLVDYRCVLADGRHVVAGSWPRTILIWNPADRQVSAVYFTDSEVTCLATRPRSSHIFAGLVNGTVLTLCIEPGIDRVLVVNYATSSIRLR